MATDREVELERRLGGEIVFPCDATKNVNIHNYNELIAPCGKVYQINTQGYFCQRTLFEHCNYRARKGGKK